MYGMLHSAEHSTAYGFYLLFNTVSLCRWCLSIHTKY